MRRFFMPTTKRGQRNRRNRKDCTHYNLQTGFCHKLWTQCVGPSFCRKFKKSYESSIEQLSQKEN